MTRWLLEDTITGLIAAIRRVRREVPGAAEIIAAGCHAHDYNDPGKPAIAWDDNQARETLVSGLVGDATSIELGESRWKPVSRVDVRTQFRSGLDGGLDECVSRVDYSC
jgi:hypothetical protein